MKRRNFTGMPARKPRSLKAMKAYLDGHFRYDTMNSWNRATSYAVCVKLNRLNMTHDELMKCYELYQVDDCDEASGVNIVLEEFAVRHDWRWQIGFNGRSGGYCVLYKGGLKDSGYKSFCTACGQQNATSVKDTGTRCGRCCGETRRDFAKLPHTVPYTSGESVGSGGTDDMTSDEVRELFKVVWDFDRTVELAVGCFVAHAQDVDVVEETVMVPKTVMVAKEREK